jgi:hypothetical protein
MVQDVVEGFSGVSMVIVMEMLGESIQELLPKDVWLWLEGRWSYRNGGDICHCGEGRLSLQCEWQVNDPEVRCAVWRQIYQLVALYGGSWDGLVGTVKVNRRRVLGVYDPAGERHP